MLGLSLCRLRFALMVVRQAVWRESSHRDASRQHHADTDAAAVVRRFPLSSAAACVLRLVAHGCRNVTFNWLVGDVSEIARMNGTVYARASPHLTAPSCRRRLASQHHEAHSNHSKPAEDVFPDAMHARTP